MQKCWTRLMQLTDFIEDILSLPEGKSKDISVIMDELTKIKDGDLVNKFYNKPENPEIKCDRSCRI